VRGFGINVKSMCCLKVTTTHLRQFRYKVKAGFIGKRRGKVSHCQVRKQTKEAKYCPPHDFYLLAFSE
jgi:hypothetical protein